MSPSKVLLSLGRQAAWLGCSLMALWLAGCCGPIYIACSQSEVEFHVSNSDPTSISLVVEGDIVTTVPSNYDVEIGVTVPAPSSISVQVWNSSGGLIGLKTVAVDPDAEVVDVSVLNGVAYISVNPAHRTGAKVAAALDELTGCKCLNALVDSSGPPPADGQTSSSQQSNSAGAAGSDQAAVAAEAAQPARLQPIPDPGPTAPSRQADTKRAGRK